MESADKISLKLQNLAVGFRSSKNRVHTLFENLNLELQPGMLVCFMGPNGIGKSSLIRTIAGLQQPLDGSMNISGTVNISVPKQISVVLTDRIINSNLSGYELISLGRYPYLNWKIEMTDNDKRLIENAIRLVNVEKFVDRKLSELSDGQVQMVMIARALAQDTPVVLLDEPTAHLDLNNRVEIMKLLKALARNTGKSILVSTHELDLALQMADYIWLTGKQKNILTGIPEDLVLDGSFDSIFQFKGFDLKTGKIEHQTNKVFELYLEGNGYEYLWTKNALERNGFAVSLNPARNNISILHSGSTLQWLIAYESGQQKQFTTLSKLIDYLNQTIAYSSR